jgi:hypothetical protein
MIVSFPFGRHKGEPLASIPDDYLSWLLFTAHIGGELREAVIGELRERGHDLPPPRPYRPPQCRQHPDSALACRWQEDSRGRLHIRAECGRCRRYLAFVPVRQPYTDLANAAEESEGSWPP